MRHRPEIPKIIADLETTLRGYLPIQRFYQGTVLSDNGYRAVLFSTDMLLDSLVTATELFMDGTFSVSNIRD